MKPNPYLGKFIVLEGLDGAGKSTQAKAIINYFAQNNTFPLGTTYEPTQLMIGGLVRSRLMNEWSCSALCLQLMFAADRADHWEKEIQPRLQKGENIICDRYFLSSVAYGAIDCNIEWLMQINSQFVAPDLTIYLDASPDICIKRMQTNGRALELFEERSILEKVALNYQQAFAILKIKLKLLPLMAIVMQIQLLKK